MAANTRIPFILAVDHSHGVPAHQAFDAAFECAIARIRLFLRRRNGVDVMGIELNRYIYSRLAGTIGKSVKEAGGLAGAFLLDNFVKRLNPFGDFLEAGVQSG